MSLGAFLLPLAISMVITAADSTKSIKKKCADPEKNHEPILSRYTNGELLCKTLKEHGVHVEVVSDNCIKAVFADGELTYTRQTDNEPFAIELGNIGCMDEFIAQLDQLDTEYSNNVQTYTYDRVMQNLPEGMSVEGEEVMDDNSIVITLALD